MCCPLSEMVTRGFSRCQDAVLVSLVTLRCFAAVGPGRADPAPFYLVWAGEAQRDLEGAGVRARRELEELRGLGERRRERGALGRPR